MFYWLIKALAWPVVTIYLRFRRYGRKHVPAKGPCIVVANHVSYLDPTVLGSACPRKLRFLIGRHIYGPLQMRWFYYMMDTIPVSTGSPDLAALRRAMEALRAGCAIGVFPEGARMPDGRIGEGKVGAAFLAARSGAPVVPAAIVGTHRAMPVGARFPLPLPVKVFFGEPILFPEEIDKPRKEDLDAFADRVMKMIASLIASAEPSESPDKPALAGDSGEPLR